MNKIEKISKSSDMEFHDKFSILKDILNKFHKKYSYLSLHKDKNHSPYQILAEKIHKNILKIKDEDDFIFFIKKEFPNLLNDLNYKNMIDKHKLEIFNSDSYYDYIQLFIKLSKKVKNNIYIESVLETVDNYFKIIEYENEMLNRMNSLLNIQSIKTSENKIKLISLINKYNLNSIVFPKEIDESFIDRIEKSFCFIQEVYNLTPSQVGGGILNLNFSLNISSCMKGAFLAQENLILFEADSFDSNFNRYMLHEYSHYLQFQKYKNIFLKDYSKESVQLLINDPDWLLFENKISAQKMSLQEAIDYSIDFFYNKFKTITRIIPIQKEEIKLFVNKYFLSIDYKNKFDDLILNYLSDKDNQESIKKMIEIKNNNNKFDKTISLIKSMLIEIKETYQKEKGLNHLWKKYDIEENHFYYSNPFEIHSHLNEHIFINNSQNLFYGSSKFINQIKPDLNKFNQMLSENYKNLLIQNNKKNIEKKITKIRKNSSSEKLQDEFKNT